MVKRRTKEQVIADLPDKQGQVDYCFLPDPWWNSATEAQVVDRTHRIEQTRNVMVYRLIVRDTIEEKGMMRKERKAELFTSVIDESNIGACTGRRSLPCRWST